MPSLQLLEPVLIADDDTDDCLIAMEAWEETGHGNELRFVQDGNELIDYLYQQNRYSSPETAPRPGLILLDLSMPKKSGLESLADIKADPTLQDIPVIVLSTSKTPKEASEAYALGAYGFVTKPSTFHEYLRVMRDVRQAWSALKNQRTLISANH
ncbi:response regulator [Candidatus Nitronereus thalassa]|uniref:Response regulator n=1 Tax=Candidatus Nitronereus thalassa TaxID=3020898 RepID=A0ABU3KBD0_9BACT|nr:response regulator [Candidatus Nitronereus thalassa]MDT7043637.1 response regulator [Candidatus Nitronereus thalassa]